MNQSEKLREDFEAAAVRLALPTLEEGEAACLDLLDERLKKSADFACVVPLNRAVLRRYGKMLKRSRSRKADLPLRKAISVAAVLLVMLCAVTSFAFRENIRNFVIEQREKYLTVGAGGHAFISVEGLYSPAYWPVGYRTEGRLVFHDHLMTLTFIETNGDGKITFQQALDSTARLVDTEHAESVESIFIGDSEGKLIIDQNGWKEILWGSEGNFLLTATEASAEELVKMAESVELVPIEEP